MNFAQQARTHLPKTIPPKTYNLLANMLNCQSMFMVLLTYYIFFIFSKSKQCYKNWTTPKFPMVYYQ